MNKEVDISSLKKIWQEQQLNSSYKNEEILNILNKKSRNYVKYILWISIAEFILFFFLNFFAWFNNTNEISYFSQLSKLGIITTENIKINFHVFYTAFKILSFIILLVYVYIFYSKYKSIRIESNLRILIEQIISFKSIVNQFILVNILITVLFLILLLVFPAIYIHSENININNQKYQTYMISIIIAASFSILFIYFYYKIIYGIVMAKLSRNLKKLKDIEKGF